MNRMRNLRFSGAISNVRVVFTYILRHSSIDTIAMKKSSTEKTNMAAGTPGNSELAKEDEKEKKSMRTPMLM